MNLPRSFVYSWPMLLLLLPSLHASTFYLTVAGLGGEPEYEQRFSGWAKDLDKILQAASRTRRSRR